MTSYDHRAVEARWQATWARDRTFATPTDRRGPKYFIATSCAVPDLRPPSISQIRGPIAADVVARAKRMIGVNVAVAHGWDGWLMPAERLAEREHASAEAVVERAIELSRRHLARLGLSTDPTREIVTSAPTFVAWTQRLFQALQRRDLAYRADEAPRPWMLRATAYADRLLDDLDALDWPAGSLAAQRWWIGRGHGVDVAFEVVGRDATLTVFAPDRDALADVDRIVLGRPYEAVAAGGAHAVNPIDGRHVPIGVVDFVPCEHALGAALDAASRPARALPVVELTRRAPATESRCRPSTRYRLRDLRFASERAWGVPFPPGDAGAERAPFVMPAWAGSCWYHLRALSPHRDDVAWDPDEARYWMNVDLYIAIPGQDARLLFARFWHKALHDAGLTSSPEPFQRLRRAGQVRALPHEEARERSCFLNDRRPVVSTDEVCDEAGADALRLTTLYLGPLHADVEWATDGVSGCRRFLDRAWRLLVGDEESGAPGKVVDGAGDGRPELRDVERALHQAIKRVTEAVDNLRMNTAIADMMVFVNEATKAGGVPRAWFEAFVKILAPFAPHLGEELWKRLGHATSIAYAPWPAFDEAKLKRDTLTIAVQVQGKLRGTIEVAADAAEADILAAAKADPKVVEHLAGKPIKREVYVKGRLVNLVV